MGLINNIERNKFDFNNFYSILSSEDKETINSISSEFFYKKGQTIFEEGSKPLGVYILKKGKVKTYIKVFNKIKILNIVLPDEFFGYRSVLSRTDQHYSTETLEPAEVLVIPADIILKICNYNNLVKDQLLIHLCNEVSSYSKLLGSTAFKPVLPRLIETLFALDKLYPNGIKISRDNLAGIIGSARETVFRILTELEKDEYIKLSGRKIEIIDHSALERISRY